MASLNDEKSTTNENDNNWEDVPSDESDDEDSDPSDITELSSIEFEEAIKAILEKQIEIKEMRIKNFIRPEPATMQELLPFWRLSFPNNIAREEEWADEPLGPGINAKIFEKLTFKSFVMTRKDKRCCLIFKETDLTPSSVCNDSETGLKVSDGTKKASDNTKKASDNTKKAANSQYNKAIVFQLRGLFQNWRSPVYYNYSNGGMTPTQIIRIIKQLVYLVNKSGYNILAIGCTNDLKNVSVINSLLNESKEYFLANKLPIERKIMISGKEIIPIYDPCHLIKEIRNHFIEKDIVWKKPEGNLTAKWIDLVNVYEKDLKIKMLSKVTDEHIYPEKIPKADLLHATQVLSQKMAATIYLYSGLVKEFSRAAETSEIVVFFDQLFDSVNANRPLAVHYKPLLYGVTRRGPHRKFWREAIGTLENMVFVDDKNNGQETRPSCLDGFVSTIQGFLDLAQIINIDRGIECFLPRLFNLDTLDRHFKQMRSKCAGDPTAEQFKLNYRKLLFKDLSIPIE